MVADIWIDKFEPTGNIRIKKKLFGLHVEEEFNVFHFNITPGFKNEVMAYRTQWKEINLQDRIFCIHATINQRNS